MTESGPQVDDPEAGRSRDGETEAPEPDGDHVPDKQIGRWKDDGGAVLPVPPSP